MSSGMTTKKKILTIRNFRGGDISDFSPLTEKNVEQKWSILEAEIIEIFNSAIYTKSLEELYRMAEDLYTQNYSPLLFNLQVIIENYLNHKLDSLLQSIQENDSEILLRIEDLWTEFSRHIRTIKNIFLYFDRSPKFFKYNTVQSISLGLFTSVVILHPVIKTKMITAILKEIHTERTSNIVDNKVRHLLRSITNMLNTLQIYEDIFQAEFLVSSQVYYESEAKESLKTMKVPIYLLLVNKRVLEEQERVQAYLNRSTESMLMDILHRELIENHISEILSQGFDELLDRNMYNEIILIYKLFQKISQGLKHLALYFKDYIIKKGGSITDPNNEKTMIAELIQFMDNLERIIIAAFEDGKEFHESLRQAFKSFINSNSKAAQLLAKYLDNQLRCKEMNDDDLELVLSKVIKLFKHVQGKDIFEAFYKKHLAKRLLLGKSANQDAENSMISKLKDECGGAFTSNIEGMFQDMNLSKTINSSFKQRLKHTDNGNINIDFSVNILTNSYWPNYPTHEISLPLELVSYQQAFQKFYLGNHSGRKLLWQPSLGHCLLKANFECGVKELQVSLFQTVVLLLFNNNEQIPYKEIQELTNLEPLELKRTLLSLACGKARVLNKNPKGKDIEENDVFGFNLKFTDKLFRVRINQIQLQETTEEEKETEKNVLVDRQFQIDAAIVRVMKQKKSIKHSVLVRELYNILDIPVNQSDLKKRIELLIEREYMERDKDNKSNYIYIA